MSILVSETRERKCLKAARNYLLAALFCALFGSVYETFSYGVYSPFMLYAFSFPLILGTLPAIMLGLRSGAPPRVYEKLWAAGVATLAVGSLFHGILDIYGTSSGLTYIYWIGGGALLLSAGLVGLWRSERECVSERGNVL